jgi:hypothetical protein
MLKIHPALTGFKRPSDHSTFSPSAAERWMECAASIRLSKDIPEEKNEFSDQGTLAHSLCEAQFNLDAFGIPFSSQLLMDLAMWEREHPNDVPEMYDCARTYVDTICYYLQNKDLIGDVLWYGLEKGIPVFPEKGCFGTGDCVIIGTKASVVIDYKHGKGKNVKADSIQLRVYLAGVCRHLDAIPSDYQFVSVIVQPRTDPAPKAHNYAAQEINEFLGKIWKAIIATEDKTCKPVEGVSHCFWCPAKRTTDLNKKCSAIMERPIKAAHENFSKYLADMSAPVEKLGLANPKRDEAMMKIISIMPLLKQIEEDALEEFKMRLQEGEAIPGLQLVQKIGNRTYGSQDQEETAKLLKEKFPKLDPFKIIPEKKVIKTITEVEKETGKGTLDTITQRKVSQEVKILDEQIKSVLGDLAAYGTLANNKEIV